ncbi:ferritin-like fold-containing protein [Georgenia sp. SUBG003]|uniref:ferritin-like fold-containing protein n=1 Tax=Georgenia sp. SUBG003 TaxID=1497974 RepID=UPI00069381DF
MLDTPDDVAETTSPRGDVAEMVGLHGFVQLAAFTRLATDAEHAPDLHAQVTISRMAAGELAGLDHLESVARGAGTDLYAAMAPYTTVLDDFDRRTPPGDWWERVVRTYVSYGVLADLQRLLSRAAAPDGRPMLDEVVADSGYEDFVVAMLGPVVAADPQLSARLALWGRRVVGEALGIAQRLLAEHPLLWSFTDRQGAAGRDGDDAAWLRKQLSAGHARRMDRLGLTA